MLPLISQIVSRLPCTQMPDYEDEGSMNTVCPVADASHLLGSQPGGSQEAGPPSQSWLVQGWIPRPHWAQQQPMEQRLRTKLTKRVGPSTQNNRFCFGKGNGIRKQFQRTSENDGEVNWPEAFGNLWPPDQPPRGLEESSPSYISTSSSLRISRLTRWCCSIQVDLGRIVVSLSLFYCRK